tara:strand:- start:1383 stop:2000 length:618 start_codon:yes stop_codon:yes gene_type:complete
MVPMTLVQVDEDTLASEQERMGEPTLPWDPNETATVEESTVETPALTLAPAPTSSPTPSPRSIDLRPLTVGDVDRLWDWIRADGQARMDEWGVDSSVSLHANMKYLDELSGHGRCAVYAVYVKGAHVGQVSIAPLLKTQGIMHIFLAQSVRGPLGLSILRKGLANVQDKHPGIELLAMTNDPRLAKLLNRIGLGHTQYVLSKGDA